MPAALLLLCAAAAASADGLEGVRRFTIAAPFPEELVKGVFGERDYWLSMQNAFTRTRAPYVKGCPFLGDSSHCKRFALRPEIVAQASAIMRKPPEELFVISVNAVMKPPRCAPTAPQRARRRRASAAGARIGERRCPRLPALALPPASPPHRPLLRSAHQRLHSDTEFWSAPEACRDTESASVWTLVKAAQSPLPKSPLRVLLNSHRVRNASADSLLTSMDCWSPQQVTAGAQRRARRAPPASSRASRPPSPLTPA